MDTTLIAKIITPKTDGKNAIGTAYPISKELVLTARHVVDFNERDTNKPISIIWPDIADPTDEQKRYTVEVFQHNIVFNGGDDYDIVLIKCKVPPHTHISPLLLSDRYPIAENAGKVWAFQWLVNMTIREKRCQQWGKFFHPMLVVQSLT